MPASDLQISRVRFVEAGPEDRHRGLLGYVSCVANGVIVFDGITIRRTLGGKVILSFPVRRDRHGRDHPYLRPVDPEAGERIEKQIFNQLPVHVLESAS